MNLMAKLNVKFMVAIGDSSLCPGVFFVGWKEVRAGNIPRWEHESVKSSCVAKILLHCGLGACSLAKNSSQSSVHWFLHHFGSMQTPPPPALNGLARL